MTKKTTNKDLRVWINGLAIAFGIAFCDGAFALGLGDGVYLALGILQIVAIYKLYRLTK